jgi:HPt (histidine-containing phosphotransfer) domain-containing protein
MSGAYAETAILDQGVLDELRASTGDDEEFVRDLISTYVEDARTNVDALTQAATAGDATAIVRPAHTLKSTSASVGAMRLSAICRDIEAAGRAGHTDGLDAAIDVARATWVETLDAFRAAGLTA